MINDIADTTSSQILSNIPRSAPFLIQFTSGTTGPPLSQRAALDRTDENDLWLNAVPYHHADRSCAIILGALTTRSTFAVRERYDRDQCVTLTQHLNPTRMGGVPTMWHDILSAHDLPPRGTIKTVTLGGASMPSTLVQAVRDRMGAHYVIGVGQSKCPVATGSRNDSPIMEICEKVGRAIPYAEIRIVDRDNALIPADDMVKISGATVYPSEVEAALDTMPGVARPFATDIVLDGVAAIGAAILPEPGATIDQVGLTAAAKERLSAFKLPKCGKRSLMRAGGP